MADNRFARSGLEAILVLRPEDQILICVARQSLKADVAEQLQQLLGKELDWDYLLYTADRHGLIALLHFHLSSVVPTAVPDRVMSGLLEASQRNTRSSLSLAGELIKLMDLLKANGVQAIPFKGPTLALQAYGDVGLRQFTDLDVLVHRRDFLLVRKLLAGSGFKAGRELSNAQRAALLRFDCAGAFDNEQGVTLDVHWDFVERYLSFDLDAGRFWERVESITVGGKQVPSLSAADHLLILCLHGFTHLWERLVWICDVACLIDNRKDIDWELLLEDATRLGIRRIILLGLFLAVDLCDAQLPQNVLQAAQAEPAVLELAKRVQEQLFADQNESTGFLDEARLHLSMRERKRDKLRLGLSLLATPRSYDWMFLPVPDSLFFLYYLLRPLRLAGKYGSKLLKRSDQIESAPARQ